ncbi:hypothetical protein [[Mycobacterium] burgundiense]|uniref:hypothetical protein n=1 Tax=[Mycobacterium] burgundiense TaxID=3064286 RepID=UPI0028056A1D|nr:hypothetical protein [Mycolicibacterium sp. MU0053]
MAVQRTAATFGDDLAAARAPVVHVRAIARADWNNPRGHVLDGQQVVENLAGLAAEGRAQHYRHPERGHHA